MYSAMLVFVVAVGAMSAFIFALSRRMERRRAGWGRSRRSLVPSDGTGGLAPNIDGWAYASWPGGSETFSSEHHSSGHHIDGCNAWEGGASGSSDNGGGGGGDCGDEGGGGGGGD
jgi:hypothetical protein